MFINFTNAFTSKLNDNVLTATDQKGDYYPPSHCLNVNVMLSNMTSLMIFAVFDPSPLTLWINCSF